MEDVTSYPVQENIASSISSVLGRQTGTSEGEKKFLEKPLTKKIIGKIQGKRSVMKISKYLDCSVTTVVKTRMIAKKYGLVD